MRCMISCLCAAAVLTLASTADAQRVGFGAQPVGGQPSDAKPTSEARALLRILCDPTSGLAPESMVMPLLLGGGLTRQAIAKAVPDAVEETPRAEVSIVAMPIGPSGAVLTAQVLVKSYDERVPAEKLLAPLAKALAEKLGELDVGHQRDKQQLKQCEIELSDTADLLIREREAIAKLAAVSGYVPPQVAEQRMLRVEAEWQAANIELEGFRARRETLERQIAQLGERVAKDDAGDAVVVELKKAVETREALAKIIHGEVAADRSTRLELLRSETELAEARAELAKYRRGVAQTAGGDRLAELKRRLQDTEIELAEADAKRELLKIPLDEAKPRDSVQMDTKKMEIDAYQVRYRELFQEIQKLRTKLRSYQPPQVTIIPTS